MAAPSILVVDDQPINVQLLKRKLEREGIAVTAAYNGLEALDFVKKEKPDLILLGVVIGYLDLVKAYYDKPEQVKKNAQHVEDAVQRIVSIIKQLSTLVVKSRPPLIKASVQRLLEGGIARFHEDYKMTAPVTIDNPLGNLQIETNYEI